MAVIGWIIFGFIVGLVARFLMPGRQPMGFILTTILGIAGSFVGGYLGTMFSGNQMDTSNPSGWIGAVVGALLLLFLYGMMAGRRTNV
ncbi:MAG: GlsB/YeaQ/YmgE family stress response membrane protein [Pirellulales bacterium]